MQKLHKMMTSHPKNKVEKIERNIWTMHKALCHDDSVEYMFTLEKAEVFKQYLFWRIKNKSNKLDAQ